MDNQEENVFTYEGTGRLLISTIAYPLENAKTLIQIGHEPIKPYPTKTLFGSQVLGLPNVFKYVKHIYNVDGLLGCYRGFIPWLSTTMLYRYSQNKTKESFPKLVNADKDEDDMTQNERLTMYSTYLFRGVVCRTVAVIVSQPLHVVTVRTIAQFVGHETKYSGIFSSLWTIFEEEGIFGLFAGLLPRLLADIFIYTVATTGVYLAHEYVVKDQEARKFVDAAIQYVSNASFYSFFVVGSCMAVTDCGLTAGSPPNMPHYHNMFHCWGHLQRIHQLKRGSSVLWRYYTPVSEKLLAGEF
ncbi:mitochondrial carrier homolog 2-like [Homalodisca vitripennis]|uniref:mitochondrial carrier homolog 2-like n=1 Tax=Homalodisca vitripennis TaxID=197043 RepID=UPI001EEAA4D7|nr:mitochondrial carrier homolog 2-like [Homalodisca vitripennis]